LKELFTGQGANCGAQKQAGRGQHQWAGEVGWAGFQCHSGRRTSKRLTKPAMCFRRHRFLTDGTNPAEIFSVGFVSICKKISVLSEGRELLAGPANLRGRCLPGTEETARASGSEACTRRVEFDPARNEAPDGGVSNRHGSVVASSNPPDSIKSRCQGTAQRSSSNRGEVARSIRRVRQCQRLREFVFEIGSQLVHHGQHAFAAGFLRQQQGAGLRVE